jgi:DNA primase
MAKDSSLSSQLDTIIDKLDIVEVISEYITLKKSGKNFKGLCPFHEEKTPSFVVNPEKQIFHCFGCGIGGNVIKFIMAIENISFTEAVITAARKAGVKIDISGYKPVDEEKRTELIKANEFAAKCYREALLSSIGKRAMDYLFERNLTEKEISRFSLGFAPNQKDFLSKKISENKLDREDFISAGLLNENGVDIFRNRIMFPIFDLQGNIAGFGGRGLDETSIPKYLNTGENVVFNKSRLLYGLNWAKNSIKEKKFVLLVEGYFDVLKLHSNGIENCAAPMGTSLTDSHLYLLKRFTDKILLVFDSDEAGIQASLRNLDSVLSRGFETKICLLPVNFDPDRFVDEYGIETFKKMMHQSKGFLEFVLNVASQKNDISTPKGKSAVAREILRLISVIPDEIEKTEHIKILAGKLDLKEDVLTAYLQDTTVSEKDNREKTEVKKNTPSESAENMLIEILLSENSFWNQLAEWKGLLTERMELVATTSKELLANNVNITPANLISNVDTETGNWISGVSVKTTSTLLQDRKQKIFQDCLKKIHKSCIYRQVEEMKRKIADKKDNGISYNEELVKIQDLLFELKKE